MGADCVPIHTCVRACSVAPAVPGSVRPRGLWPASLLCPWGSPGRNTGEDVCPPGEPCMGQILPRDSHSCLLGLPHWQADSLPLAPLGKPCSRMTGQILCWPNICLGFCYSVQKNPNKPFGQRSRMWSIHIIQFFFQSQNVMMF